MVQTRRGIRISLRALFILVAFVCIFLGIKARQANRQRLIVIWVKEHGGEALYDFELEESFEQLPGSELPGPDWLCRLTGKDYFANVTAVALDGTQISDFAPLLGLPDLVSLDLEGTHVRDVANLADFSKLEILSLRGTPVSDISALAGLSKLEYLNLKGTQISDISAVAGLTRLRWLDLSETKVCDFSSLLGLRQISHLGLNHMEHVEQSDVVKLQHSMPDCEIEAN